MERLQELHVLERANGEWAVTPSAREYIASKVQNDREIFLASSLLWLRHLSNMLGKAFDASRWEDVFGRLNDSRSDIIAALRLSQDTQDRHIREAVAPILHRAVYYLYSKGFWNETLAAAELFETNIQDQSQVDAVIEVSLTWAIRILRRRHGHQISADYFDRVEAAIKASVDISPHTAAKLRIARIAVQDIADDEAAASTKADADFLLKQGDFEWACRATLQVGNYYSESGNEAAARDAYNWLLSTASGINLPWATEIVAIAYGSLGILACRAKKFDLAINFLGKSTVVAQLYDRAVIHAELARAYALTKKLRLARRHIRESVRYCASLGVTDTIMETELNWDRKMGAALASRSDPQIFIDKLFGRRLPAST